MTEWDEKVKVCGTKLKKKYIIAGKNVLVFNHKTNEYKLFDSNGNIDNKFHDKLKEMIIKSNNL